MEELFVNDACKKAQALVSEVAEPSYRVAAFQVVLGRLLANASSSTPAPIPTLRAAGKQESGNHVRSNTQRRILEMLSDKYFDVPRLPSEVRDELKVRGFHHNPNDVGMALLRLAQKKLLRRMTADKNQYRYVRA